MDLQSISLGIDIATAASIIVAVATYIHSVKKENEKQSNVAREHARIINLANAEKKYNELLGKFIDHGSQGKLEEALKVMALLHSYCHEELRRDLVAYGTGDNLIKLKEIILNLREANKEMSLNGKFDAVQLTNSLVELDINMLTQLRGLLTDEPEKTTVNIVKDFGVQRFGYISK